MLKSTTSHYFPDKQILTTNLPNHLIVNVKIYVYNLQHWFSQNHFIAIKNCRCNYGCNFCKDSRLPYQ